MNASIIIIFLFPMLFGLIDSDRGFLPVIEPRSLQTGVLEANQSTDHLSSVLELFPEFVKMKEEINKKTKAFKCANVAPHQLKNYRVKGDDNKDAGILSELDCWIKCIETDGCTVASFQTVEGTCELSRFKYVHHDVFERAVGWKVITKHAPVVIKSERKNNAKYSMTLDQARSHCKSLGSSLATLEDLKDAYETGFEYCTCGWVDNGFAYIVMQNPDVNCMNGIGIIACFSQSTWDAWCKVPYVRSFSGVTAEREDFSHFSLFRRLKDIFVHTY